uniref:Uncharacterized protein AlNc14C287G10186 n=1 Tax=Albugo laibachii Nc14 TaxID=890382 RepID=F0WV43_9STRA|nr:conserved hypothetical protein [Albugo laibachii Nc14]|eukprot:CCA25280.1 conserved hypothetical protein [Albugo laibachii Nc14]
MLGKLIQHQSNKMDQVCQEMKIQRPAFGGNKVLKAIEKVSPTKETVCRVHSKTPEGADKLTPVCLKRRKKATRNSLLDKIHKVSAKSIAFDTFALTEDEDVTKTAAGPTLTVQTPDKSGGRKQDTPSQSEGYEQENLEKKRLMRNVCKLTSPDEATEVDQKHRRRRRERRTEALLKESVNDAAGLLILSLLKQIISVCTQPTISFLASIFLERTLLSADGESIVVAYERNCAVFTGFMKAISFDVDTGETISSVFPVLLPFLKCILLQPAKTNLDHQLSVLDWITRIAWLHHSKRQSDTSRRVTVTVLELLIDSLATLHVHYTSLYTLALLANTVDLNFVLSDVTLTQKLAETLTQCILLSIQDRGNPKQLSDILSYLKPLQRIMLGPSLLTISPSLLHPLGYILMECEGFPAEQSVVLQILEYIILKQSDSEERGYDLTALNTLLMPIFSSVHNSKHSNLSELILRRSHSHSDRKCITPMDVHVPKALDIVTHFICFQRVTSEEHLCSKWIETLNGLHFNRLIQYFLLSLLFDARKSIQKQVLSRLEVLIEESLLPSESKEVTEGDKKREGKKWILKLAKMLTLYVSWQGRNAETNDVESSQLIVHAMYLLAGCSTTTNESTRIFLRVIESWGKNPKLSPLALRLLCTAWKNDSRLYPELEAAVCKSPIKVPEGGKNEDGNFELQIVQMASILSICQWNPERGLDFVGRLQMSLSHAAIPVVCLAIDSISALCENGGMDFFSAFKAVESKIRREKIVIDMQDPRFELSIVQFYALAHREDFDITIEIGEDVHHKQRKQLLQALWEYAISTKQSNIGRSVRPEDVRAAAWHAIRVLPSSYLTHVGINGYSDLPSLFQHAVLTLKQPQDHQSRDHLAAIMIRFMVKECNILSNSGALTVPEDTSSHLNERSELYGLTISTTKSKEVARLISKLAQSFTLSKTFSWSKRVPIPLSLLPHVSPIESSDSTRKDRQLRVLTHHLDGLLTGINDYLSHEPSTSLLKPSSDDANADSTNTLTRLNSLTADCIYMMLLTLWLRNWNEYFRFFVHDVWTIAKLKNRPLEFVDVILDRVSVWMEREASVECPLYLWLAVSSVLNQSMSVHYDTLITKWVEILHYFIEKLEILAHPNWRGNSNRSHPILMLLVSIYHHLTWVRIDNDTGARLSHVLSLVKSMELDDRILKDYVLSFVLLTQARLLTLIANHNEWRAQVKDAIATNLATLASTLVSNSKIQEQIIEIFNLQTEIVPIENGSVLVAWALCTASMPLLPGFLLSTESITKLDQWLENFQQVSDNSVINDLVFCMQGAVLSEGVRSSNVNLSNIQKYFKSSKIKLEDTFSQNIFSAIYLPNLIVSYPSIFIRDQFNENWLKKTYFAPLENDKLPMDQRIALIIGLCNFLHLGIGTKHAINSSVLLDPFSISKIIEVLVVKEPHDLATACTVLSQSLLLREFPIVIPRVKYQVSRELAKIGGKAPILCLNLRFLYDEFLREVESEGYTGRYTAMRIIVQSVYGVVRDGKVQCVIPIVELDQLLHLFWKLYGCNVNDSNSERVELAASIVRLAFTSSSCERWILYEFFQEDARMQGYSEAVIMELVCGFTELSMIKEGGKNELRFFCLHHLTKLALVESTSEQPPNRWILMLTTLLENTKDTQALIKDLIKTASEDDMLLRFFKKNDPFSCEDTVVRFVEKVLLRVCETDQVLDEEFVSRITSKVVTWITKGLSKNLLHLFLSTFLKGLDPKELAFSATWRIPSSGILVECPYLIRIILEWVYTTSKAEKGGEDGSLGLRVYQVLKSGQTQQSENVWMMHLLDVINSISSDISSDMKPVHIQLLYQLACLGQKISNNHLDVWNIPILLQSMSLEDEYQVLVYFLLSANTPLEGEARKELRRRGASPLDPLLTGIH